MLPPPSARREPGWFKLERAMTGAPDAILFDLDNTLVDDAPAVHSGLLAFYAVHGLTLECPSKRCATVGAI